jgi:hypothetical protein
MHADGQRRAGHPERQLHQLSFRRRAARGPQKLRIVSGDSVQSYLVDKLLGAAQDGGCFSGKQMPLGKAPLSASDISLIASWSNAGTP